MAAADATTLKAFPLHLRSAGWGSMVDLPR
jgi:hypothetical protein